MVALMVILFSTKCFLFIYMYIDLLKLKAYKIFENSDADSPGFFFKEANLFKNMLQDESASTCLSIGTIFYSSCKTVDWAFGPNYPWTLGMAWNR